MVMSTNTEFFFFRRTFVARGWTQYYERGHPHRPLLLFLLPAASDTKSSEPLPQQYRHSTRSHGDSVPTLGTAHDSPTMTECDVSPTLAVSRRGAEEGTTGSASTLPVPVPPPPLHVTSRDADASAASFDSDLLKKPPIHLLENDSWQMRGSSCHRCCCTTAAAASFTASYENAGPRGLRRGVDTLGCDTEGGSADEPLNALEPENSFAEPGVDSERTTAITTTPKNSDDNLNSSQHRFENLKETTRFLVVCRSVDSTNRLSPPRRRLATASRALRPQRFGSLVGPLSFAALVLPTSAVFDDTCVRNPARLVPTFRRTCSSGRRDTALSTVHADARCM